MTPGIDAGGVVALAIIARHAAQNGVDRLVERLAFDVPQRQIERAEGVHLLAPRRIEVGAVHILPEALDVLRILSDQAAGALLQSVPRSAFADARDAGIGLHLHHQVALVEERIRRCAATTPARA